MKFIFIGQVPAVLPQMAVAIATVTPYLPSPFLW